MWNTEPSFVDIPTGRFAYHEVGEGPLVLLLHGFPDNAVSYRAVAEGLAAAGYRAVCPYMPGFPPTETTPGRPMTPPALAEDVRALAEALSDDGTTFLVGNDWGGTATHAAITRYPEVVRAAVIACTAHPATFAPSISDPEFIQRIFHLWYFQQPFADWTAATPGLPFVEHLWNMWSPHLVASEAGRKRLDEVVASLDKPGVIPEAMAYYRGLVTWAFEADDSEREAKITVPSLSLFGMLDPTAKYAHVEDDVFVGPYRRVMVDGIGHFPHLEMADEMVRLVVEWFTAHQGRVPAAAAEAASG